MEILADSRKKSVSDKMANERKIQNFDLSIENKTDSMEPPVKAPKESIEIPLTSFERLQTSFEQIDEAEAEEVEAEELIERDSGAEVPATFEDEEDWSEEEEWDDEAEAEEWDEEEEWSDESDELENEPVKPVRQVKKAARKPKKRKISQTKKKKKKHIVIPIITGIILLFLVIMIIIGLDEMNSFKSHAKNMKAQLKEVVYCIKDDDFDGAEQKMTAVDEERVYLREKINDPFWSLVAIFPFFNSDIQAVNELLDIVDVACNEIVHPFIVQAKAHPLSELKAEGGFNVNLILSYLDFAETIIPTVDDISARIKEIEFGPISKGAVGDYTEKISSLVETYEHFKEYIPLVEDFCGHGEDKFYLMLAQNSAEIRASGGFPGSMGTVRITDGVLEIGDFMSVYDLLPMGQAFNSGITDQEIQLFGYMYAGEAHDSNFNPHFARVAEITKASYEEWNEEYVDGVISLTPAVIQEILDCLDETVTLDDGSELNGENATRIIQRDLYIIYQGQEGYAKLNNDYIDSLFAETAKKTMGVLVDNFKLEKLPDYVELFERGFANRTIMLWMADRKAERVVEKLGASGNLNNDKNNPKAGIYFSTCDPSKLGMFVEYYPTLSEPTILPNGAREYTMTVTFNNYLNEYEDYYINSRFILGGYGGAIQSYIYFFAPKGGTVSDFEIDPWMWEDVMLDEYEGLELGYILNLFLYPDEPITITYKITTAPGVETPLTVDMTPTLQDYR